MLFLWANIIHGFLYVRIPNFAKRQSGRFSSLATPYKYTIIWFKRWDDDPNMHKRKQPWVQLLPVSSSCLHTDMIDFLLSSQFSICSVTSVVRFLLADFNIGNSSFVKRRLRVKLLLLSFVSRVNLERFYSRRNSLCASNAGEAFLAAAMATSTWNDDLRLL